MVIGNVRTGALIIITISDDVNAHITVWGLDLNRLFCYL